MTVVVAAFNEEAVIERRLENLLALDYPADRLEIVVDLGRIRPTGPTSSSRRSPPASRVSG